MLSQIQQSFLLSITCDLSFYKLLIRSHFNSFYYILSDLLFLLMLKLINFLLFYFSYLKFNIRFIIIFYQFKLNGMKITFRFTKFYSLNEIELINYFNQIILLIILNKYLIIVA